MIIYIGADHKGFELKKIIKEQLKESGYEVRDLGNVVYDENDDYPLFAKNVAEKVSQDFQNSRGILICGSGAGVDIVANKFPNIRSVLAMNIDQVSVTRADDDTNVLSLPADYLSTEQAKGIIGVWLSTPFSGGEKYKRRLKEIEKIELGLKWEIKQSLIALFLL